MSMTMSVRQSARALPAAILVAALLAGSPAAAAAPLRDARTVSVKAWTAAVCKGFAAWERQLTKADSADTAAPVDAAAAKAVILRFLAGAEKAAARLAKTLKKAGVPSVEHGREIATTLVNSVKGLRTSYADAKPTVAALPTDDPAAAQALATQLQAAESTLLTAVAEVATRYPTKKLDEAFATTKACSALG